MVQIIKQEREQLEKFAADLIAKSIREISAEKDNIVLAIPGGRSVSGIFNILKHEDINWSAVHIFLVDERLVSIDDEQSNFKLAKDVFIDELINEGKLPRENVHPFIYKPDYECRGTRNYKEELGKYGGRYDIILLSSGEDGHVGALYPGHHSVKDDSEFFITMDDSPKPPAGRMSASLNLLKKAVLGIVLFFGDAKKDAYRKFTENDIGIEACPAKVVHHAGKGYVLTDIGVQDND